ncbi:MAG: mannosyltransferase family protein [Terriglobales bacterium]
MHSRAPIMRIILTVLIWRVLLALLFMAAASRLPAQPDEKAFTTRGEAVIANAIHVPLWQRGTFNWDAYYYLHIAAHGYRSDEPATFAFFPLFPALVAMLHKLGLGLVTAGLLLNLLATGFAAVFLYLMAMEFCSREQCAQRAVWLFLLFPSSYFLAAFYSEAVFCALGFGALWLARKRQWLAASMLLALLTATRPTALCFVLAVAVEYLDAKQFSARKLDRSALAFLAAPAGLMAYMAYLQARWGDALLFARVQHQFWDYRAFTWNLVKPLVQATRSAVGLTQYGFWVEAARHWVTLACFVVALLALVGGWRKLLPSYRVLIAASLLLFLASGSLGSVNRFVLPLFPVFLVLSELSGWRYRVWLTISAGLMTFLAVAFVNFRFTG